MRRRYVITYRLNNFKEKNIGISVLKNAVYFFLKAIEDKVEI